MQFAGIRVIDVDIVRVIVAFCDAAHGCVESGCGDTAGKQLIIRFHKRVEGRTEIAVFFPKVFASELRQKAQPVIFDGAEPVKALHEFVDAILSPGLRS